MEVLGVDIGGSGIKAAPVDVTAGALTRERIKVPTPQPSKPKVVADAVRRLVGQFGWSGKAGITFPGVVTDGVIRTASATNLGLDGCGVGTLIRSRVKAPAVTSTGAALIPEPPMSTPRTSTAPPSPPYVPPRAPRRPVRRAPTRPCVPC